MAEAREALGLAEAAGLVKGVLSRRAARPSLGEKQGPELQGSGCESRGEQGGRAAPEAAWPPPVSALDGRARWALRARLGAAVFSLPGAAPALLPQMSLSSRSPV